MMDDKYYIERLELEGKEDWRSWLDKIPEIKFPNNCKVRIIPPFAGCMARLFILDLDGKKKASVYLDVWSRCGCEDEPYWELYDFEDIYRFDMDDVKGLEDKIKEVLD